ncbi:MAG: hypothetical protein ACREDZ_01340 [Kiloniellales bacterium]
MNPWTLNSGATRNTEGWLSGTFIALAVLLMLLPLIRRWFTCRPAAESVG